MEKEERKPFEFKTWGFEIYDFLNIALSVFLIVYTAIKGGEWYVYLFRGIEILASLGLIFFIVAIWKNHEEVRERKYFSLAFLIAWVGVLIQGICAITMIPETVFNNPIADEIVFEVFGTILIEVIPCALFFAAKTADKPSMWWPSTLAGIITTIIVSCLCLTIFFVYKDLSSLELEDYFELVSFSLPILISTFGIVELSRWKKTPVLKENEAFD